MSSKDGGRDKDNMEKPLKGTVLCCTSIPPEHRTHMAEAALQMGAEHKLDLTSDVTHLIVGDSNTPKYKYVAKEREDIKVLQLEWVEAVRQTWMRGDDVNLEALEEEYTLPTFAGLRICVTGFEDLTFRAQLQEQISANGGQYRGDLTKEVTHLIAHTPEGKKYQYATQWEVKVVGLRWLKDSLERRMILDESLYHPTIPQDKQGAGAWNRQAKASVQLGKRNHEEEAVPTVPRKLRRTASAKLGGQSETIWGEIVNGPQTEELVTAEQLPPPKPIPALKVLETKSFATDTTGTEDDRRNLVARDSTVTGQQPTKSGIFFGFGFFIYAFTAQQTSILREHLLSNDGEILDSLADFAAASNMHRLFVIVPNQHAFSDLPDVEHLEPRPDIVTDMWTERCLMSKRFFEPDEHVLNRPIRVFPIPGFEKLTINSTGLINIDLYHVSKVVRLLGAEYDQVLKVGISVLLCNPSKAGEDKLLHARQWRIPTVSIEWLWACIRSGEMRPFHKYLLRQGQTSETIIPDANIVKSARHSGAVQARLRERPAEGDQGAESGNRANVPAHGDSFANETDNHQTLRPPKAKLMPGEGFIKSPQQRKDIKELHNGKQLATINPAVVTNEGESQPQSNRDGEETGFGLPLQGLSTNSPPKPDIPSPRRARVFRSFNGQYSVPRQGQGDKTPSAPEATSTTKTTCLPPQPDSINGAIQELLSRSKSKNATSSSSNGEPKKKRLLGRALSNMSNSSREGSNIRASRASSIDSVNTDGLGSIILDDTSQNKKANGSGSYGRSGLTGRASGQERNLTESLLELDDAALYREEYVVEEEEQPQMTQLGYENPDDAVALREMLAERRRNRTRKGQEDIKPSDTKEEKRIKDDVAITGSRRRTRQRSKV